MNYDLNAILADYAAGMSENKVAAKHNVSRSLVNKLVADHMPDAKRSRGATATFDHVGAIAMYETGKYSQQYIADKYGVTQGTIFRTLQRKAPHLLGKNPNRNRDFNKN